MSTNLHLLYSMFGLAVTGDAREIPYELPVPLPCSDNCWYFHHIGANAVHVPSAFVHYSLGLETFFCGFSHSSCLGSWKDGESIQVAFELYPAVVWLSKSKYALVSFYWVQSWLNELSASVLFFYTAFTVTGHISGRYPQAPRTVTNSKSLLFLRLVREAVKKSD